LDLALELVDLRAELTALVGRQAAQRLHQAGDAALLAEGGHARGIDGGEVRRLLHRDQRFAAYGRKISHLSLSKSRHEKREPAVQAPSLRSLSVRLSGARTLLEGGLGLFDQGLKRCRLPHRQIG